MKDKRFKLTDRQIKNIRAKYKPRIYTMQRLSKEYGIALSHIFRIIHHERRGSI